MWDSITIIQSIIITLSTMFYHLLLPLGGALILFSNKNDGIWLGTWPSPLCLICFTPRCWHWGAHGQDWGRRGRKGFRHRVCPGTSLSLPQSGPSLALCHRARLGPAWGRESEVPGWGTRKRSRHASSVGDWSCTTMNLHSPKWQIRSTSAKQSAQKALQQNHEKWGILSTAQAVLREIPASVPA